MQSNTQPGSLSSRFEGFGSAPSEGLWDQIAVALEEKEKRRRGFIWWWIGGASAAAVVVILSVVWMGNTSPNQPEETVAVINTEVEKNDADVVLESKSMQQKEEELPVEKETDVNIKSNSQITIEQSDPNDHAFDCEEQEELIIEVTDGPVLKKDPVDLSTLPKTKTNLVPFNLVVADLTDLPKQKRNRPWEFGFNLGYWQEVSYPVKNMEENLADSSLILLEIPPTTSSGTNADQFLSGGTLLEGGTVRKHLNVNGFIGKYFADRWSWRVGIDLTRTTYESNSVSYTSLLDQSSSRTAITSVGLPVSLRFDMIQRSKIHFKSALTLLTEIPVYERLVLANPGLESTPQKTFTKGYMGALQFDLPLEFRLNPKMRLSVTPGYRYYFMQRIQSTEPLLRKDHWLGGTVGLTWQL